MAWSNHKKYKEGLGQQVAEEPIRSSGFAMCMSFISANINARNLLIKVETF